MGGWKGGYVLVGSESDYCFLIDFGGSYTDGWVDKNLMETRAGDDQAAEKIAKFLNDGVRPRSNFASPSMNFSKRFQELFT